MQRRLCITFHYVHHLNEITQYQIYIANDKLQWYSQVKYPDHVFNCRVNISTDVANRKGWFIGCANSTITQWSVVNI